MMRVECDVNVGFLVMAFARWARIDLRPALRKVRRPMHADQRDHRDKQRGPNRAFAPLAPSTRQKYAELGYRRNRRILARLPNARKTKIFRDKIQMMSPVKWSKAHQDGPTRVGRGSLLPGRQYMWISRELQSEAARIVRDEILASWHQIIIRTGAGRRRR